MTYLTSLGACCAFALAVSLASTPGRATTLAFDCEEQDAGKPAAMTITYDGEASGTLKIVGSFGEMSLPATMTEADIEIDGQKVRQTGIRAFGKATVLMPAKAALEACIAGKRDPGETDDILGLMACRTAVETASSEIKADVEIALHATSPEPFVYLKRTYLEKSEGFLSGSGQPGGLISIESVPPPKCVVH